MKKRNSLLFILFVSVFTSVNAMNGLYTVGNGGDFPDLSTAVGALSGAGIDGNLTFSVISDIIEPAAIQLALTNNTYKFTIKPAVGIRPIITLIGDATNTVGDLAHCGFGIKATSNVTIDGSNTVGGTTKDMTFNFADETGTIILVLYENCDNVTVKNLNMFFATPMNSAGTRGIYLDGQSTGVSDNFTLDNCTIANETNIPFYGLSLTGSSKPLNISGMNLKNNTVFGKQRALYLSRIGDTNAPIEITGNTFNVIGGENSGQTTYYVYYANLGGIINVIQNKFSTLTTSSAAGTSGVYGIGGGTTGTQTMNIVNNFIGGDCQSSGVAIPAEFDLISIKDPCTYNILNNTFYLPSITNASKVNSIIINNATANVNITNNIIVNRTDNAISYCINKTAGVLTSDHNVIFTGSNSKIGFNGSDLVSLTDWQNAGFDANSKSVDVNFANVSIGNLAISGASIQDGNLSVPRLSNVLTDLFGTTRSDPTYVGAHESTLPFTPQALKNLFDQDIKIISTKTGIQFNVEKESNVELYDIKGMLLDKERVQNAYSHELNKGVYVIRINGIATKFVK